MPGLLAKQATRIFQAALRAADPVRAVQDHLTLRAGVLLCRSARYRLRDFDNVYVVGAGKASVRMAAAIEQILGTAIRGGLINTKYGHARKLRRVQVNECGHPVPDANGQAGAERIAAIARAATSRDLLIVLISGGASALLPLPAPPVTLAEKQSVTRSLLECGATIHEINTVRKHISAIKGGQLARLAHPATVLTLILSDVIGDDLDVIGSGPTVPDRSTFADASAVFEKYGIARKTPPSVLARLSDCAEETPKPGDSIFRKVQNRIIGSNRLAIDAAARAARTLGYRTSVLTTTLDGEAREVANVLAAVAREIRSTGQPSRAPACILSGGETTVTIRGSGRGGRNQELALAAALGIAGLKDVVILSGGTDGTDGPTDAAGAIADGSTIARAQASGLDAARFLADNDSYRFFDSLGGLIKTGPTGTNVADLQIVLVR
jgi:hydroxypyruvate reductase